MLVCVPHSLDFLLPIRVIRVIKSHGSLVSFKAIQIHSKPFKAIISSRLMMMMMMMIHAHTCTCTHRTDRHALIWGAVGSTPLEAATVSHTTKGRAGWRMASSMMMMLRRRRKSRAVLRGDWVGVVIGW